MSKHNKAREIWLDRYRAALVQACGSAAVLGFTDHAATLCEMIDAARVDKCDGKCYNTSNTARKARKNEEVKTMTIYGRAITNDDMANIADYMRDDIREELHAQLAPCSNEQFLRAYLDKDPDFIDLLRSEFDFAE